MAPSVARRGALAGLAAALALVSFAPAAQAQACCVGAGGLTPGWLGHHEVGALGVQLRASASVARYPLDGPFYGTRAHRELRSETSIFGTVRALRRGQLSALVPLVAIERLGPRGREQGRGLGDAALSARADLVRAGEARWPGVALLAGLTLPTGRPPEQGTGLLAADVTGLGTPEVSGGAALEQTFGPWLLHATALAGLRLPRDVLGVSQALGPRGVFVLAGGYAFPDETAVVVSLTHTSEGDATVGGAPASGTGLRRTDAALLVTVPLGAMWRLRTSLFSALPRLGENAPMTFGTSFTMLAGVR